MAVALNEVRDPHDVPTAWFVVLERARETGDRLREQEAIQNLARLGVVVAFVAAAKGGAA